MRVDVLSCDYGIVSISLFTSKVSFHSPETRVALIQFKLLEAAAYHVMPDI